MSCFLQALLEWRFWGSNSIVFKVLLWLLCGPISKAVPVSKSVPVSEAVPVSKAEADGVEIEESDSELGEVLFVGELSNGISSLSVCGEALRRRWHLPLRYLHVTATVAATGYTLPAAR